LRQICGLSSPHGRGAKTQENAGGYQGVKFGIELRADVRRVTQHRQAESPLDGESLDEESGHEDAREYQGGVDGRKRDGTETIAGID